MHQNLRTSFTLNEETLSLSEKAGDERLREMQMLLPAQQYGTFFCIYAKLNGSLKDGGFYPKSCELFLQNYYGDVTVGLVKVCPEIDIMYDEVLKEPVYLLKINLKALHAKTKFDEPQPIRLKSNPSLNNYTKTADDKWSISTENGAINPKFLTRVLITYDRLDSDIFDHEPGNENANKFIDSHRYERDGDELYEKKFKRVGQDSVGPLGNTFGDYFLDKDSGKIITYKCRPSYVQFKV